MVGRLHRSPLFPYTPLFRSVVGERVGPPLAIKSQNVARVAIGKDGLDAARHVVGQQADRPCGRDRKQVRSEEPRLNSSHVKISYAVFCLKKKNNFELSISYR